MRISFAWCHPGFHKVIHQFARNRFAVRLILPCIPLASGIVGGKLVVMFGIGAGHRIATGLVDFVTHLLDLSVQIDGPQTNEGFGFIGQ